VGRRVDLDGGNYVVKARSEVMWYEPHAVAVQANQTF
jgi:hypothetical protein